MAVKRLALLIVSALLAGRAEALPVVPGAFGFGMDTRAAYGCLPTTPTVIKVTSLADTNTAGTLRYAMLRSFPRVIVFEISGYIDITSDINIVSPCMTIAGQTAPSPGITVRMSSGVTPEKLIVINTHDVLIQHLRFRPGGDSCNSGPLIVYTYSDTGDGQGVVAHALFYNVVMDHVSMSWGQDEGLYAGHTDVNGGNANVTFWRSIAAEGLYNAPLTSPPTCGGTLGDEPANGHGIFIEGRQVDVIQTLMSTNRERNPMLDTNFATRLLNNIVYNWQGEWGIFAFNKYDYGAWSLTAVGNRFITGPSSNSNTGVGGAVQFWWGSAYPDAGANDTGNQAYLSDNTVSDIFGTTIFATSQGHGFSNQLGYNPAVGSAPSAAPMPSGYTPIASSALEAYLLPKLGARPADRDSVDARIIANVANRTGPSTPSGYVIVPNDVGGYPTLAVHTRTLDPPSNPDDDDDMDGYTNLEEWLHGYALVVEGGEGKPPDDPGPARGGRVLTDTFTDTDGTLLTSHTSDSGSTYAKQSGSTGDLEITSNHRLMGVSTGVPSLHLASASVNAQIDIDLDLVTLSLIPGNSVSAWARATPTGPVNGYGFAYETSSMVFTLFKFVNDVREELGACIYALSGTTHVTWRVRDASKYLIVGGSYCAASNDNAITAPGQVGLSVYYSDPDTETEGIHFDNLQVTNADVGGGVALLGAGR